MNKLLLYAAFGITAMITWSGCHDRKGEGAVKTTFVLSDTMLNNIRIDTARIEPARYEWKEQEMLNNVRDSNYILTIPFASLIFDHKRSYVMVFKDKYNVECREVAIMKLAGDTAYLINGLRAGEKVVSKNQLQMYNALNDYKRHSVHR
ncbi:hypothetical protein [uncultured Chitinophaga sp.]|uniref:hypothetical protein n=1 Tax=uncultured Chitinophaga sp. TaxID=339340 RepID=UPI0025D0B06A|nr:hypothetical protein [uncultured Chitinophaga sp.]